MTDFFFLSNPYHSYFFFLPDGSDWDLAKILNGNSNRGHPYIFHDCLICKHGILIYGDDWEMTWRG